MSPVGVAPPARVFYGWWVALAFVIIVFLTTGVRFTVGPFLKPIVSDLGLDRGSFSLVISLSLFLYGAFMPLVGGLVDRVGARLVCAGGGVLLALTDATGGYGAAFATTGTLPLFAAGLSAAVRQGRPGPGRAGAPVAGGR